MNNPTLFELYAGIRGFSVAFECEGFQTVGVSEIDEDKNIVGSHWYPHVPNLGNIRDADFVERVRATCGVIDVLTGGVPCQPASALGQMRGADDERWLWPETIGVVGALRPLVGVFENPPAILVLDDGRAWNGIVSGLAALGYDLLWDVLPAAAFGAGHLRERVVLIITDGDGQRWEERRRSLLEGKEGGGCNGSMESGRLVAEEDCKAASNTDDSNRLRGEVGNAAEVAERSDDRKNETLSVFATDTNHPRLQGHAWHGADLDQQERNGAQPRGPVAPPDLRGRVSCSDWWNETHTGIPVLADGLPSRLVEAAARCAGDAIVPQVFQPIARAIRKVIDQTKAEA